MEIEIDEGNQRVYEKKPSLINGLPHILLVEDNSIALHLIETLTKQAGLEFTSAMDGEEALQLFKTQKIDLIITDIGLPGISGYELAFAIRQLEKNTYQKPVPIIGLTALPLHEAKRGILQSGIDNIFLKPINLKMIQGLVKLYCS